MRAKRPSSSDLLPIFKVSAKRLTVYFQFAIHRLLFSALTRFPGPRLWALTRLLYVISRLRGNLAQDIRQIHEEYGDAVRVAPNEVSFATPDAWRDVHTTRSCQRLSPKNPLWYQPPPGQGFSLPTTPNYRDHARRRGLLKGAFTEKALQDLESVIQSYVDLPISSLHDKASSGLSVNMVNWFVGDLGFGEPFDCLVDSAYHPWVSMIFDSLRVYVLAGATRYYPLFKMVLMRLVPKKIRENAADHHQLSVDKVHRWFNLEQKRHDFMTPAIELNTDMQIMSLAEIQSTFSLLVVAGSGTTATALSGITNHLIQNPSVMQSLVSEIRGAFKAEKDITIESLRQLPYLCAVISEGLRVCNPIPMGRPRLVLTGGDTVCGHWLPSNV
ncbi:MAG: hypothetical protein ASARMPREDX12_005077 [Alectoria sarmentosa]|nr:MAG: hypothetical protein ASARMPREDX12_005077 [Alectoria sarmentosa]